MLPAQPGVLAPVPRAARFLALDRRADADLAEALDALAAVRVDGGLLVGLGPSLLAPLGVSVPGLRPMPALLGPAGAMPVTPADLWVRVAGDDPGDVHHRTRAALAALRPFTVIDEVDGFVYAGGRDLTGYEDGTENPRDEAAAAAALARGHGPGFDGGSVVAVQRWVHDLRVYDRMTRPEQDDCIGRDRDSNAELPDAPPSAHVKRTAQESFDPAAFVVRRSMPWRDARGAGLEFVAFGRSLDAFEAQLRRMVGLDDGVPDALFRFSRPVRGATYWCPPVAGASVDLRALGR